MAKKVVICSDSTCDLSPELARRFDIKIIPLTINLGDSSFFDDGSFTPEDMYQRYRLDGTLPKTSAPSLQEFIDFFSPYIEAGCEIVHLDISGELSSSYSTACIAAAELGGVYPVDSRMLSSGVALLALEGAECRDRGMSAEDIAARLSSLTDKVDTSFVLDTLEFMWKGGRCSGVTALGANLLKLKPALEMKDGKLGIYKKYRGGIDAVYRQYIKERLSGKKVASKHVFITSSGGVDEDTLAALDELASDLVPGAEIHRGIAGCTISSHCGPKCLGVLFINQ